MNNQKYSFSEVPKEFQGRWVSNDDVVYHLRFGFCFERVVDNVGGYKIIDSQTRDGSFVPVSGDKGILSLVGQDPIEILRAA